MADHSFDDLLQALQTALLTAQRTLKQRQEGASGAGREGGDAGGSPQFTFALPRGGTEEYEMLTLPASSFRTPRRHRISMLSLEFDCALEERKVAGASVYAVTIKGAQKDRWWRKKRRRMQIVLRGTGDPTGMVTIDGAPVMEIPVYGVAGAAAQTGQNGGRVPNFLKVFRQMWRQERFIMTEKQSARAREVLGQD